MSTEFESSVESLDHPVDNAPVRTLQHKGLTIEGYSRAAVQTYWRVPELKLGFDLGGQPWSFMSTPNWFVSHVHLDHVAALPGLGRAAADDEDGTSDNLPAGGGRRGCRAVAQSGPAPRPGADAGQIDRAQAG